MAALHLTPSLPLYLNKQFRFQLPQFQSNTTHSATTLRRRACLQTGDRAGQQNRGAQDRGGRDDPVKSSGQRLGVAVRLQARRVHDLSGAARLRRSRSERRRDRARLRSNVRRLSALGLPYQNNTPGGIALSPASYC